jgi:Sugar (and other) transporter
MDRNNDHYHIYVCSGACRIWSWSEHYWCPRCLEVYHGRGRRRGLSSECRDRLRVRIDWQSWSSHDNGIHRSGLGKIGYAAPFPAIEDCDGATLKLFVLAVCLVALATVQAYKDAIIGDNFDELVHVDYCWRILIGLGCVPGAIALYFRLTIPETPRFTMDIERDVQRAKSDIDRVLGPEGRSAAVYWVDPDALVQHADAPRQSRSDFITYLWQPGNLLLLFGAAWSWFAIDASPISFIRWRHAIS